MNTCCWASTLASDGLEHLVELGLLGRQRHAQVAADEPFREQVHLAQHEGAVELGQHAGLAGQLELDQGVDRVRIHEVGVVGVQALQVGGGAEVGQQQEAGFDLRGRRCRHGHAGVEQQAVDVDEGRHVFALRRGVHGDQGVAELVRVAPAQHRAGNSGGSWHRTKQGAGSPRRPGPGCSAMRSAGPGGHPCRW
jgi:hypothetical protein